MGAKKHGEALGSSYKLIFFLFVAAMSLADLSLKSNKKSSFFFALPISYGFRVLKKMPQIFFLKKVAINNAKP